MAFRAVGQRSWVRNHAHGISRAFQALALLLLAQGCQPEAARTLAWSFSFSSPETAALSDRVEVSIMSGSSCTGGEPVYRAEIARSGAGPTPPRLLPGRYALSGRALSRDCAVIAFGCVQVSLPAEPGARFSVVLDDVPARPYCEGACADVCMPPDNDDGSDAEGDDASEPDSSDQTPSDGDDEADGGGDEASSDDEASPDDEGDLSGDDAGAPDSGTLIGSEDAGVDAGADDGSCMDGAAGPGGHCYRFVTSARLSWQLAEDDCVDWGGHLVSFNTPAEELWVSQQSELVVGFGDPINFWIGFSDQVTETLWTWSDGSSDPDTGTGPSIIAFDLDRAQAVRFQVPFDNVYTHWGRNLPEDGNDEPNNGNPSNPSQTPGEDCAVSSGDRLSGPGGIAPRPSWDDQDCRESKFYVCER